MRAVHVIVSGEVQGVGFRYTMQSVAERAGAHGWVRNRYDGTVEAVVAGTDAEISAVVDWARTGPRWGRVDGIEVVDTTADDAPTRFEVRADA